MTSAQQNFIDTIAPMLQKYAALNGYNPIVVPAMIAQACQESFYGSGLSSLATVYHNYWGMKVGTSSYQGKSVNMATKEEYTQGTLTSIRSNFRAYDSMEDGVKGYFDFLKYPNYNACKGANTPELFIYYLKAGGWATSSTYIQNLTAKLDTLNLRKYGVSVPVEKVEPFAGTVTASALRVRLGAGSGYRIMQVGGHDFLLPYGICVAFDGRSNGWGKLSGINGWVSLDYIAT